MCETQALNVSNKKWGGSKDITARRRSRSCRVAPNAPSCRVVDPGDDPPSALQPSSSFSIHVIRCVRYILRCGRYDRVFLLGPRLIRPLQSITSISKLHAPITQEPMSCPVPRGPFGGRSTDHFDFLETPFASFSAAQKSCIRTVHSLGSAYFVCSIRLVMAMRCIIF